MWCGRWAKNGEAVIVKFSLQGNKTKFRESDLQQSLHAALLRKNLMEDLVDSTLPNAEGMTGPWQQTMAAAAAVELANDGWMTIFSTEEDVAPVDFEIFVLDHTGQSHNYSRPDGKSHAQLMELRKEQDSRKIVMHLTWPPQFKTFGAEELQQAKELTMDKVKKLFGSHAEDVAFATCKDDQGYVLPKILIFARHPPTSSMQEFAKVLPTLRYIDVGLRVLVRTSITKDGLAKLGIQRCCFAPACIRGEVEPGRNGRPARQAPDCGASQRAYAARTCLAPSISTSRVNSEKQLQQEMLLAAAKDTMERVFKTPQECRAHMAGRCHRGDQCFESHTVPNHLITCCSVLKPGQKHYKARFSKCTSLRVGKECLYSHEPQAEMEQEPTPTQD